MTFLDMYQSQLQREREGIPSDRKKIADIGEKIRRKNLDLQKPNTSQPRAKSLNSDIDRLMKDQIAAERKLAIREKKISDLEKKVSGERKKESNQRDKKQRQADRERTEFQHRTEKTQRQFGRRADQTETELNTINTRLDSVERQMLDHVGELVREDRVPREFDVFLSHAGPDADLSKALRDELVACGLRVWHDGSELELGVSQFQQINLGLANSRVGLVLVTPSYMTRRVWTERELGALFAANRRVIPVIDSVQWPEVAQTYPLLADLAGLDTVTHPLNQIAEKVASAVGKPIPST